MRTLFFHRENDYTGSTRALANLLEAEYPEGMVQVITIDPNRNGFLNNLRNVRIIRVAYPSINGRRVKLFSYVISLIHSVLLAFYYGVGADKFYLNTIYPFTAAIVGRILNKKIYYHIHEKFVTRNLEVSMLEFVFYNTKAQCIFVSNYVMNQYKVTSNIAIVKYNKLPQSFVNSINFRKIELRERKNIIMISSLSPAKGIDIFYNLSKILPEFNFKLILSATENQIESYFDFPRPENLSVLASTPNIHIHLAKADLLVNLSIPSLWIETFGMTLIEAMAYGLPVIAPNVGGPKEIITDNFDGYLVDVNDLESVKSKIISCMEKTNYEFMASNSLLTVKKFIY